MKVNAKTVFDLIKYCLFDEKKRELSYSFTEEDIKALYTFSKAHEVCHIVGLSLKKLGLLSEDEFSKKFSSEIELALFRYLKLAEAFREMKAIFQREKIPFIPLKGTILREYYPEPYLRTSSDIDIFIRKEDLDRAVKAFTDTCGYKVVIIGDEHDVSLMTPSGMHLELHYRLIEKMPEAEKILENIWDIAVKDEENEYFYRMSAEYFMLYHMVHMARHFIYGGVGLRPILDLYFIKNKMDIDLEKAYDLLKKAELYTFTKEAEHLFDVWFNDAEHTELSKEVHKYILLSGVYGNLENAAVTAQIKNGGKFKTVFKRIFMPYKELKTAYPVLIKYPVLTPFYQIRRWLRLIFFSRKKVKIEMQKNAGITDDRKEKFSQMLSSLDLKISK